VREDLLHQYWTINKKESHASLITSLAANSANLLCTLLCLDVVSSPPQCKNRFTWHHIYRSFFETSPRCSVAYDKPNNSNMALNDSTVCRYFHILHPCTMISLLEMWLIHFYNGLWHTRWNLRYTDVIARRLLYLHFSCFHVTDTPSCYMFRLSINSEIIHLSSEVIALTGLLINRKKKKTLSSHVKVQNTVAFLPVTIAYFRLATTRFKLPFTTWLFSSDNLNRSFVAQMKCKTPFREIAVNTNTGRHMITCNTNLSPF